MAFDPLNPNERTALGLTVDPVEDPKANELLEFLSRAHRQAAVTAGEDPLTVAERAYKEINPARRFMADFFRGMQANMNGQPATTVRESLFEQAVTRQQLAQKQAESNLQRITQMMTQNAIGQRQEQRLDLQAQTAGLSAIMQKYNVDQRTATALSNIESRESIAEEQRQLQEQGLVLEKARNDETINYHTWQKDIAERNAATAERRVAAQEKRNDILGRKDGDYTSTSPEGQALQEVAAIGNTGETKSPGQAKQLQTEIAYIAENIDNAQTPEERQKWVQAGQSKVLFLASQNLSSASQKDAFNFRLKTLATLEAASTLMDKVGYKTGFFSGKLEDWLRKYNGSASSDEITRLFRLLNSHFFEYRQSMSGAAFSEQESAAYESISPTTDKEFSVNLALMEEMEKESVRAFVNQIKTMGPQAMNLFVTKKDYGTVVTINGHEYIVPEDVSF